MTKIINKNIVNIKIVDKKKSKRRKRHSKLSHVNAAYSNVATMLNNTNRPQNLDLSTATSREKEGIVNQAIMDVKKSNDILLLKDKDTENNVMIPFTDHTPKPSRLIQTDIRSPAFFNKRIKENSSGFTMNEVYSNDDESSYNSDNFQTNDNVVDLGEKKTRGRPMNINNNLTNEQLQQKVDLNKKQNVKYYENKSINPMHIQTRQAKLNEQMSKNREESNKVDQTINNIFKSPTLNIGQNKLLNLINKSQSITKENRNFLDKQNKIDRDNERGFESLYATRKRHEIQEAGVNHSIKPTKLHL